jgi:hypothetical protein
MLSQHSTVPSSRANSNRRPGLSQPPSARRVVLIKDGLLLSAARRKQTLRKASA